MYEELNRAHHNLIKTSVVCYSIEIKLFLCNYNSNGSTYCIILSDDFLCNSLYFIQPTTDGFYYTCTNLGHKYYRMCSFARKILAIVGTKLFVEIVNCHLL